METSPQSALESLPRICNQVCGVWGSVEAETYINGLVINARDGARQGLPVAVAAELLWLLRISKWRRALDMHAKLKISLADAQKKVEMQDAAAAGHDIADRQQFRVDWNVDSEERKVEGRSAIHLPDNIANIPIYPADTFSRTPEGDAEIRNSATTLSSEALALLVLNDGKTSVGDLEQKTPRLSELELRNQLRALVAGGLLRAATLEETEGFDFSAFFNPVATQPPSPGALSSAAREAAATAPRLRRDGFYVCIARRSLAARPPNNGSTIDVLVVEDDPDVATLVTTILKAEGYGVDTAANRSEILARLRRQPLPDAILLDVTLLDANGFDVLQSIRQHAVLKQLPVIMMTADARPDSIVRGLIGGADGYITKPFDPAELSKGVKAVLGLVE